jgi:PHD/YefM family antitoxin component YafN of YafNO toxin-antitoxin module
MTNNTDDDRNIPIETEDRYETLASQEEIYLEETEEEVRAILTSDDQSSAKITAKYWRSKIEELELDWEIEIP